MITLPKKISKDLRDRIESHFADIVSNPPDACFKRVATDLPKLLDSLSHHRSTWLGQIADHAERMFALCAEHTDISPTLEEDIERSLIASLHYLVEPNDVIPDYELADGYLDDAYVLNLCLKMIQRRQPDLLPRIETRFGQKR